MSNLSAKTGTFRQTDAIEYFVKSGLLKSKKDEIIDLLLENTFMVEGKASLKKSDVAKVLTEEELRIMECEVVTIISIPQLPLIEREKKEIEDILAKQDTFFVNWTSTDCDGVHGQGFAELKSYKAFENWCDDLETWVEGPFSYKIEDQPIERKTWGAGWGIN